MGEGSRRTVELIVIVGDGNVAYSLIPAFEKYYRVECISSRNLTDECLPSEALLYLFTVADNALESVVSRIGSGHKGIFAHTSGTLPASIFSSVTSDYGVFYPLQTFSKGRIVDIEGVPVFVEGNNPDTLSTLESIAGRLSSSVTVVDDSMRKVLHVAGVMSCNFTNHLLSLTEQLLVKNGMSLDAVKPLVAETLQKSMAISPHDAQTGPARRGDTGVIARHIELLEQNGFDGDIYKILSQSIINEYSNEPH